MVTQLVLDVQPGDTFTHSDISLCQYRGSSCRLLGHLCVGRWETEPRLPVESDVSLSFAREYVEQVLRMQWREDPTPEPAPTAEPAQPTPTPLPADATPENGADLPKVIFAGYDSKKKDCRSLMTETGTDAESEIRQAVTFEPGKVHYYGKYRLVQLLRVSVELDGFPVT